MIVVANTKELEEEFDLSKIRDDELIRVEGGLKGKSKYNANQYVSRTTYTAKTLKQIIQQMKKIESRINPKWDDIQKAKYIFMTLGKSMEYEYDISKYVSGNCSNLTGLITGKAICAGYSLIFKEMMDRQGIQCDYMRGVAGTPGDIEKHAWNVLKLYDKTIPIELTWYSIGLQRGTQDFKYFGADSNFFKFHSTDNDEIKYNYNLLRKQDVEAIDISNEKRDKSQISEWEKRNAMDFAFEKTFKKGQQMFGTEKTIENMKNCLKKYITEGNVRVFTRDEGARDNIVEKITVDDMIKYMSENYVLNCTEGRIYDVLGDSTIKTVHKYGSIHAEEAVTRYVKTGIAMNFTRDGNARDNILQNLNSEMALDSIISEFVNERVRQMQRTVDQEATITKYNRRFFKASDLVAVQLPEQEKTSILKKAIEWIKEKTRNLSHKNQIEEPNNKRQKDNNIENNSR